MNPKVIPFYEEETGTFSYLVQDPNSLSCAIIDPVLNFNLATGEIGHDSANAIVAYVKDNQLEVQWIIETHVHADHLTAARYIKESVGGLIAISDRVAEVQKTFGKLFNMKAGPNTGNCWFDHLFSDNETYRIGNLRGTAISTPGHTPACMTHKIGDSAFVGDTLLQPDSGTARADFPGGDAAVLYQSIQKILALPSQTRIFVCHDYGSDAGREVEFLSSVDEERRLNIHINGSMKAEDFIRIREARDKTLEPPQLILPSLQVNICGGSFPAEEDNGIAYLKIPVNAL